MVLRIALYGCVVGLFAFAHPAIAEDPGWHTGKVLQILARMSTNPHAHARGVKIVLVDMEPPFTEPCGTRFVAFGWPEDRDPHLTREFRDAAIALLTDAMFAGSTVSVYLSERFNSSGERSCGITMAQVAAAGIRPTPTATGDTGTDIGTGDTGTDDDADDDTEYGWGGRRDIHRRNYYRSIVRSTLSQEAASYLNGQCREQDCRTRVSGETLVVVARFGESRREAQSKAMRVCVENTTRGDGGRGSHETCQLIAEFPTDSGISKPYCWAYAQSNDRLVYGTGGVDDAPNETYYATAERIALDACTEKGGSGCAIAFSPYVKISGCHGGPDLYPDY